MTLEITQALLLAFAVTVILMPPFIGLLRTAGFGKQVAREGALESHLAKTGTPTMGGALIIAVVGSMALLLNLVDPSTFAPLATLALVGLLGMIDDWLNARTGAGIRGRQKLVWQIVVALVAAWQIQRTYAITAIAVPFVGAVPIHPVAYVLFAAFAIVATSNGVNLTDGLDGLAGGVLVFAFIAYMIIALLNTSPSQPNLAVFCALMIGAILGFLWFNVHPAQVFMGDAGALGIGATLAVTALITGQILLLPLIGIIFVVETGSVIINVSLRKVIGRRLFRASPIHYHFELGGWPEGQVTTRFWIVAALAGILGVTAVLATLELG